MRHGASRVAWSAERSCAGGCTLSGHAGVAGTVAGNRVAAGLWRMRRRSPGGRGRGGRSGPGLRRGRGPRRSAPAAATGGHAPPRRGTRARRGRGTADRDPAGSAAGSNARAPRGPARGALPRIGRSAVSSRHPPVRVHHLGRCGHLAEPGLVSVHEPGGVSPRRPCEAQGVASPARGRQPRRAPRDRWQSLAGGLEADRPRWTRSGGRRGNARPSGRVRAGRANRMRCRAGPPSPDGGRRPIHGSDRVRPPDPCRGGRGAWIPGSRGGDPRPPLPGRGDTPLREGPDADPRGSRGALGDPCHADPSRAAGRRRLPVRIARMDRFRHGRAADFGVLRSDGRNGATPPGRPLPGRQSARRIAGRRRGRGGGRGRQGVVGRGTPAGPSRGRVRRPAPRARVRSPRGAAAAGGDRRGRGWPARPGHGGPGPVDLRHGRRACRDRGVPVDQRRFAGPLLHGGSSGRAVPGASQRPGRLGTAREDRDRDPDPCRRIGRASGCAREPRECRARGSAA